MKNIRLVILESPYDSWTEPLVATTLMDFIGVKLRGYGSQYPYGVLPVDGADLISTHMSVCETQADGSFKPIMAIRWTSMKKCRLHYIGFPGMGLLQQANATEHVTALEKIISDLDKKDGDLFYSGALSIDPSQKKDKAHSIFIRELLTLMYVEYYKQHGNCELMAGGTVRFKIDNWLNSIGHTPLHIDPINVKHLAGEVVRVMHLKEFSFEALRIAKKWNHLWNERLVIGNAQTTGLKKTG